MQNQNVFKRAADVLYGSKRKEEQEQKNLRSSLLNELKDDLEPKHILYSSNDELKKMKEEKSKSIKSMRLTGFKNGANTIPLPEKRTTDNPESQDNSKEISLNHKVKLPDKIPFEQKVEKAVSAKIASFNPETQETSLNNVKPKIQDNSLFSSENTKRAREFIQRSEGYSDVAYQDKAGVWTIGYGHTGYVGGRPITKDTKISKEEAEVLYKKDFENHIAPLKDIKTPLTENQKIALASFIYNFGPSAFKSSELRKKIEMGDIKGAANEFDRWIYVKNKNTGKKEVSKGLVNRRKREKELFLKPDDEL